MPWSSHSCNIAGIHISQEVFATNMLKALKPSLQHDHKHVLRLLRLYGDQASGSVRKRFYLKVNCNVFTS